MTILLLGAQGQLGWELGASLSTLGQVWHFGRKEADLSSLADLEALVRRIKPRVIINAAAHTKVDQAETEPALAHTVNAEAPGLLARLAREYSAWLVHYSTDYVYDGKKDGPYAETDTGAPLNVYGRTKLAGDLAVMESGCRHLIFRTSWVFSQHGRNFPKTILELARQEDNFAVVADQYGSPTGVELISSATALALSQAIRRADDVSGLYNLVASGYVSWHQYAIYVVTRARELGWSLLAKPGNIRPRSTEDGGRKAVRPTNSRLSTEKFQQTFGLTPPPWQYYVDRVLWAWTKAEAPAAGRPPHVLGLKFIQPMNSLPGRLD